MEDRFRITIAVSKVSDVLMEGEEVTLKFTTPAGAVTVPESPDGTSAVTL